MTPRLSGDGDPVPLPGGAVTERPALTYDQREVVWGFESEVALISSLARHIDAHVVEVNRVRAELVERLARLDALVEAADEPHLEQFLRGVAEVRLPSVDELLPERLYGP